MIIGQIAQDQIALAFIALLQEGKMNDDLVEIARSSHNGDTYTDGTMKEPRLLTHVLADEITRLRAAINNALLEPWLDGQLNGTWQQEPIGPNETPEEAVKRLVSVRAEWAVYKNNCENPVIAELRAALATARCEGMEEAAKIAENHSDLKGAELLKRFSQVTVARGTNIFTKREIAAAIRAAAKERKP